MAKLHALALGHVILGSLASIIHTSTALHVNLFSQEMSSRILSDQMLELTEASSPQELFCLRELRYHKIFVDSNFSTHQPLHLYCGQVFVYTIGYTFPKPFRPLSRLRSTLSLVAFCGKKEKTDNDPVGTGCKSPRATKKILEFEC